LKQTKNNIKTQASKHNKKKHKYPNTNITSQTEKW